jgi:hypothetical protein
MLSERQLAKRVRGWRRAPLRTPPHPPRCSQSSQLTTFSREGRGKAPSPVTRHSLDIRHCLCYERHYLAHSRDAVARHTRLRSKGGARGRICSPHSGGFGAPLGRQKERSARSSLVRPRRAKHPPSRVPGNVVLELSQMWLRLRWRVPQWSAGRRARPEFGALPRPLARTMVGCAFRRSASLGLSRGMRTNFEMALQSSGAGAPREQISFPPA